MGNIRKRNIVNIIFICRQNSADSNLNKTSGIVEIDDDDDDFQPTPKGKQNFVFIISFTNSIRPLLQKITSI